MTWVITGGAGFVGCNLADRLLADGNSVAVIDNLSRPGSESNLNWLQVRHSSGLTFVKTDVRDYESMLRAMRHIGNIEVVVHLAAQVAVTTSVIDPRRDFETNALGTLNVLEAIRESHIDPILLYASTNKVYGALGNVGVICDRDRYYLADYPEGISELTPLDFHSPYGCSKGAADQYVHDYHRIYGLRTVVFRKSCIYGPRQFGVEDQGWVAWFVIAAALGRSINIYGDGKQVRDILYIDDLVSAYRAAVDHISVTSGQVYNIGGGPGRALAVWKEFGPLLETLLGKQISVSHAAWRPGDQKIYISDITKAERDFGWHPRVSVEEGIQRLLTWILDNRTLFD